MPRTEAQNQTIKAASKQKILNAAMQLFSTIGYQQASVAKIAVQAGVSKGLIYHHFESKEAVLEGLLEMLQQFEDSFLPDNTIPAELRLNNLLNQVFELTGNTGQIKFLMSLSIEIYDLPQVKQYVQQKIDRNLGLYVQLFQELDYDHPEMEAWHFSDTIAGLMLHVLTASNHYPVEKMKQFLYNKYQIKQP